MPNASQGPNADLPAPNMGIEEAPALDSLWDGYLKEVATADRLALSIARTHRPQAGIASDLILAAIVEGTNDQGFSLRCAGAGSCKRGLTAWRHRLAKTKLKPSGDSAV